MIVVCGEALIDLVADGDVLRPHLGGGPFNVAVALGHLDVPVGFCSRISSDRFGRQLRDRLHVSGVDLRYVLSGDEPTPLAIVQLGLDGEAEYGFYLQGTADGQITPSRLPEIDGGVSVLHFGTLSLVTEPTASTFEGLMSRESGRRLIVLDPNVRPVVIGDHDAYLARFESWLAVADVVKISDADAAWLYPDLDVDEVCQHILGRGACLVAATLGPAGATIHSASTKASVPPMRVTVVDTVGAGDSFGAGVLRWLWEHDALTRSGIEALTQGDLHALAEFANSVAALVCSRAGASPPTMDEVRAFAALAA
jgi:fructokinase